MNWLSEFESLLADWKAEAIKSRNNFLSKIESKKESECILDQ